MDIPEACNKENRGKPSQRRQADENGNVAGAVHGLAEHTGPVGQLQLDTCDLVIRSPLLHDPAVVVRGEVDLLGHR